jgi:hypothetical protein
MKFAVSEKMAFNVFRTARSLNRPLPGGQDAEGEQGEDDGDGAGRTASMSAAMRSLSPDPMGCPPVGVVASPELYAAALTVSCMPAERTRST